MKQIAESKNSVESRVDSTLSTHEANSSIVDEKSGLRSHEREDRINGSLTKRVASLPDLSPQDEFASKITTYAILCISFLICVFNPYAIYVTDITQFDSTQTLPTLCALFGAFLIASFIAIYLISFIPKKFAKIPAFAFSLTLFIGLVYSFILVGDYGAMDHFSLQKTPFDDRDALVKKAREFVAVVAFGVIFIALLLKKLLRIWQVILITLFVVSAINATNIAIKRLDSAHFVESGVESQGGLPRLANESRNDKIHSTPPHLPFSRELFSYSKSHKNIVVIVLDAFSGSHTKYILSQFPHLRKQLDGFTHFPNTLTSSIATISSIATLIGGEHYTTHNMNARRASLIREIDSAFISTANAFASENFSVSLMAFVGSDIKNIATDLNRQIFTLDAGSRAFDEFYMEGKKLLDKVSSAKSHTQSTQVALLLSFGLFRFVPEFPLRVKIYNEGKWLLDKKRKKTLDTTTAISYAASFYALSRSVSADSTKPTFKYFHSMITHSPQGAYFDGQKCVFFDNKNAWDDYPHRIFLKDKSEQHYDAEACALHYLADFVGALKNAGIYDNTQIFVVSDHGASDSINMPRTHADALFLFKDFWESGAVRTDNRLMANYDISSIFCANLPSGCPSVGKNILAHYPKKREIIFAIPVSYLIELHEPNRWLFDKRYKASGDISGIKEWVEMQ